METEAMPFETKVGDWFSLGDPKGVTSHIASLFRASASLSCVNGGFRIHSERTAQETQRESR